MVGERTPNDVDIALLTEEKPAWKLWDEIAEALGTERLDLVDLKRASPVLLFEIIRTVWPIYASNEARRGRFVLDALHLYRDTAPLRRRQSAALKRRIDRWCEESIKAWRKELDEIIRSESGQRIGSHAVGVA